MEANQFREPWNKGKLVGQKPPLKPKDTSLRGRWLHLSIIFLSVLRMNTHSCYIERTFIRYRIV